jgi:transposase
VIKNGSDFSKKIEAQTPPDLDLHLIVDNYSTPTHAKVTSWLKRHPRFHVHFIPTSSSWLNMIERWFREITHTRISNGSFRSVDKLEQAIRNYIDHHNANPKTFVWTKKAADILETVERAQASLTKVPSECDTTIARVSGAVSHRIWQGDSSQLVDHRADALRCQKPLEMSPCAFNRNVP